MLSNILARSSLNMYKLKLNISLGIQIKEGDCLEILKHKPANLKKNNNNNSEALQTLGIINAVFADRSKP